MEGLLSTRPKAIERGPKKFLGGGVKKMLGGREGGPIRGLELIM